jgi:hypothetical protein
LASGAPKQGFFSGGQKKAGEGSRLFWRWQPGPAAAAAKKGRGRVSTRRIGDVGVGRKKIDGSVPSWCVVVGGRRREIESGEQVNFGFQNALTRSCLTMLSPDQDYRHRVEGSGSRFGHSAGKMSPNCSEVWE